MWVLMNALRKPSLGAYGHVTKILPAKNGHKLTNLNRYISVITNIDKKRFVTFERTINLFFWLCSFTPTWMLFFLFCIFLLTFFFLLLPLSTFKPQNALYSKFERLKISVRTFVRQKLGARRGSPQSRAPKFWTSKPLELHISNFRNG